MNSEKKIAIIGASGLVGQEVLRILSAYDVALIPLGRKSKNQRIQSYLVENIEKFDFKQVDGAVMSVGEKSAVLFREKMQHGILIDNSTAFYHQAPMVVPEIYKGLKSSVLVSPNCVTIPLTLVLYELMKLVKIKSIWGSSYQSVSGCGKKALMDYQNKKGFYDKLTPCIGQLDEKGDSEEELAIIYGIQKVLGISFPISWMAVRVPLAIGHGMHVRVSLQSVIALDDILECLSCCPYIKIEDRGDVDIKGSHMVFVSRVRLEGSVLDLWIASDNLIRGAAYNMCEIAKWCFDLREKNDVC